MPPTSTTEPQTSGIAVFGTKRCFELHFRLGNRPPSMKIFLLDGDLPKAIARSKAHCDIMNYRFCGCYPHIVDLDIQEKSRNDEIYQDIT